MPFCEQSHNSEVHELIYIDISLSTNDVSSKRMHDLGCPLFECCYLNDEISKYGMYLSGF
ncbi:hypothetical protein LCGC14_0526570 [marine sediment metagenome]|uniref:Uncharacterized protein n=1 Tax=marine sediment metagenome TaxID=412755 RepID=A0A0F9SFA4_9ZZZZ